ncbi:MAG: tetratricopeptide repeat protein [Deltaproteobacteria bacterium]|nr:tetratricopeptide repeat protein [Deltaproteobacteria bacterium]
MAVDAAIAHHAALDARLVAVEEFARMAAERISSQIEVLNAIEARSSKQENLTNRLLGVVDSLESLSPVRGPAALKSADYRGRAGSSSRLYLLVGAGVLVVALLAWGIVSFLGDDTPAPEAPPRAPAVAAQPEPAQPVAEAQEQAEEEAAEAAEPTEAPQPVAQEPAKKLDAKAASERKEIRRKMFEAVKKKKWGEVATLGLKMRGEFPMDWETEYQLADALRRLNRSDEAVEMYRGFTLRYPDNKYTDEALFRLASLLHKQGKSADAASVYKTLADNPDSKFRADASKALKSLNK